MVFLAYDCPIFGRGDGGVVGRDSEVVPHIDRFSSLARVVAEGGVNGVELAGRQRAAVKVECIDVAECDRPRDGELLQVVVRRAKQRADTGYSGRGPCRELDRADTGESVEHIRQIRHRSDIPRREVESIRPAPGKRSIHPRRCRGIPILDTGKISPRAAPRKNTTQRCIPTRVPRREVERGQRHAPIEEQIQGSRPGLPKLPILDLASGQCGTPAEKTR